MLLFKRIFLALFVCFLNYAILVEASAPAESRHIADVSKFPPDSLHKRTIIAEHTCSSVQITVINNALNQVMVWAHLAVMAIHVGLAQDRSMLSAFFGPLDDAGLAIVARRFEDLFQEVSQGDGIPGTRWGWFLLECQQRRESRCVLQSGLLIETLYMTSRLILVWTLSCKACTSCQRMSLC